MARYEHLPIYKSALDVAVWFEQAVAGFSRNVLRVNESPEAVLGRIKSR